MAIRIHGTVAGLPIDLTVEGLSKESLAEILTNLECVQNVASQIGDVPAPEAIKKSPVGGAEWALNCAMEHIAAQGEIASCDLINYLTEVGMDDVTIKRTLLFLREKGEVETVRSENGQQRIYRCKTPKSL